MLHYAVVFFVIALIAALLGFGGLAAGAAGIAKIQTLYTNDLDHGAFTAFVHAGQFVLFGKQLIKCFAVLVVPKALHIAVGST